MKFDDVAGREFLQAVQHVFGGVDVASGKGRDGQGAFADRSGRRQSPTAHGRAALEYGSVEQTFAHRRHHVVARAGAARALAEYRHPPGIAAEPRDVLADPAQRHHLILHPVVAGQDVVFGAREPYGARSYSKVLQDY